MNFGFLVSIAFLVLSLVRGCIVDVQQPTKIMRKKEQQSVSLPCSVNISGCGHTPQISWFVFRKDFHYQIDVSSQPQKYNLEQHDLKISSLSKADCGVYYCAAALPDETHSGAQAIGQGTTLKVSERGLNTRQSLLLTLLVLLTVYSLIVLGLIICIKTGRFTSVFIRRWSKSKKVDNCNSLEDGRQEGANTPIRARTMELSEQPEMMEMGANTLDGVIHTSQNEDSARQVIFSGVVQELCKRNLSDTIQARYRVSQDKSNGLQNMHHSEDIYQNLDE